jgi:hypothetical protein
MPKVKKNIFYCDFCDKSFNEKLRLKIHIERVHIKYCCQCKINLKNENFSGHNRSVEHKNNAEEKVFDNVFLIKKAFSGNCKTYRIKNNADHLNIQSFISEISDTFKKLIQDQLDKLKLIKCSIELFAYYIKPLDEEEVGEVKSFRSKLEIITETSDLDEYIENQKDILIAASEEFSEKESGWALFDLLFLEINIIKYNPTRGSCYKGSKEFISRGILNVKNNDDFCFLYSLAAALFPAKSNKTHPSSYKKHVYNYFNIKNLSFPFYYGDTKKFEDQNPSLSISIFTLDEKLKICGPIYKSDYTLKRENHVSLLFYNNHYSLITDYGKLVHRQFNGNTNVYCPACIIGFPTQEKIKDHITDSECFGMKTNVAKPNTYLEFRNRQYEIFLPYLVFADFETLISKITPDINLCEIPLDRPSTTKTSKLTASAFCYRIVSHYDDFRKMEFGLGENCVQDFLKNLKQDALDLFNSCFRLKDTLSISKEEREELIKDKTHCDLCNYKFVEPSEKQVDHDHFKKIILKDKISYRDTFRHVLCKKCNFKLSKPCFLPVFFHNASFDIKLFLVELCKFKAEKDYIKIINKNKENFIVIYVITNSENLQKNR